MTGDPRFLKRDADGSARVRLTFTAEEAARIEEAAGQEPIAAWIRRMLVTRARYHLKRHGTPESLGN